MALYEWRLTPEYLNDNWTEELLHLMLKSRNERVKASRPAEPGEDRRPEPTVKPVDNAGFLKNVNGFGGGGIGYERR